MIGKIFVLTQVIEITLSAERIDNLLLLAAKEVQEGFPQPYGTRSDRLEGIARESNYLHQNGKAKDDQ